MGKRVQSSEELRERILDAMKRDIGISEKMAEPFVKSVMRCFAGEQPYFPATRRTYPLEDIRSALMQGASVGEILKRFDLSRSTFYVLFPGGTKARSRDV